MGNPAAVGVSNSLARRARPQLPVLANASPPTDISAGPAGLVSQIVGGGLAKPANQFAPGIMQGASNFTARRPAKKPNKQRAQRINPPEVPTRKLY